MCSTVTIACRDRTNEEGRVISKLMTALLDDLCYSWGGKPYSRLVERCVWMQSRILVRWQTTKHSSFSGDTAKSDGYYISKINWKLWGLAIMEIDCADYKLILSLSWYYNCLWPGWSGLQLWCQLTSPYNMQGIFVAILQAVTFSGV